MLLLGAFELINSATVAFRNFRRTIIKTQALQTLAIDQEVFSVVNFSLLNHANWLNPSLGYEINSRSMLFQYVEKQYTWKQNTSKRCICFFNTNGNCFAP